MTNPAITTGSVYLQSEHHKEAQFHTTTFDREKSGFIFSFVEIGQDKLVLNKSAYIHIREKVRLGDNRIPFLSQRVFLEILEDVPVTHL